MIVRTKTQRRIVEAVSRGYKIVDGQLYGPKGKLQVGLSGKQRYPTFSTNWGSVFGVPVHMFAAYCYFGEAAFVEGVNVRHFNGDTLDYSETNILLGSSSANQMDKAPSVRSAAAAAARAAQGSRPLNAKLNDKQVASIRAEYVALEGKKAPNGFTAELCRRHGVSRTVINKVVRGEYYAG